MSLLQRLVATEERRRSLLGAGAIFLLFSVFIASGIQQEVSTENLHALGRNPWTPVLIVLAMTGAWAFALPASVFFFVTPLLFPPLVATLVICAGSVAGTSVGYVVARFIGGPWIERFREYRITKMLRRHSSFAILFALRVFPSSPHGWINYAAGLLKLPFTTFLFATMLGVSIKAFLYSVAIAESVGATSIRDALSWQTITALTVLATLSVSAHIFRRRWEREVSLSVKDAKTSDEQ